MKYLLYLLLALSLVGCVNPSPKPKGRIYINDYHFIILSDFNNNVVDTIVRTRPDGLFYHDVYFDSICFSKIIGWPKTKRASWCYDLYLLHKNKVDTLIYEMPAKLSNIKFSPDGKCIALLYSVYDNNARAFLKPSCAVFYLEKRGYSTILEHMLALGGISWAKDGQSIYMATFDGNIVRVDLQGKILDTICNGYAPAVSPDGRTMAFTKDRSIYLLDLSTKKKRRVASKLSLYIPHEPQYIDLAWSPDSKYLLYQGQYILAYLTDWSSQYVYIPLEGWGLPKMVANITARGYGAAWVP
ncbi:MAG: hypothetical protein RDU76_10345 [Candidatus Edwardsbacteria bacterium]|nr:hypothetical protein [Candidatus Edwardsbacteria bacterium]